MARQGRAVFVPVDTGIAGERYFEALSGVAEGDLIVTGPFSEVRQRGAQPRRRRLHQGGRGCVELLI